MKIFEKVLVANRGEIALRVIRALREMGIPSVAVYSEADRTSLHVREADESVCIGAAAARESYLRIPAVLAAAKMTGSAAIHPGYGFLSENAGFSKAVSEAGMTFIGPGPRAIEMLGYKSSARKIAIKHGVPVTPGTMSCVRKDFKKEAKTVGYPLMIKAAAGGGGKGMRIVRIPSELLHAVEMAGSEALAAFGDASCYFEKYIDRPRHVEIQIAADSRGNIAAFPERDCSIQRRHQKLLEESPSPAVDPALRKRLADAAVRLVKASGYTGVGTVEFLLDREGRFYFMEVNTRLQVEHCVTEMVTGVDLVKEQILIAAGEKLGISAEKALRPNGHAIEHRINAEDPARDFAPSPGKVTEWILPGGPGVRVDTHIYTGYTLPVYYDSLLAKLIVWGPDRKTALARSARALSEFHAGPMPTTISFHRHLEESEEFASGDVDTGFLDRMLLKKEHVNT
ncbi:MAG: acetyl-CoA carboxylase biotin carboxylase subunit [bacterium]